jgi:hypothetical protein
MSNLLNKSGVELGSLIAAKVVGLAWSGFIRVMVLMPFAGGLMALSRENMNLIEPLKGIIYYFAGKSLGETLSEADYARSIGVMVLITTIGFQLGYLVLRKRHPSDKMLMIHSIGVSFIGWLFFGLVYAFTTGDAVTASASLAFFVGTAAILFAQFLSIRIAKSVISGFSGEPVSYDKIMK